MATCMICGRNETDRKPMALIGSREFGQSAPSGYQWKEGRQPVTRVWKLFGLLDVGICPQCVQKQFQKEIATMALIGCACALAAVPLYSFFNQNGGVSMLLSFLAIALSIAAAIYLLGLFRYLNVKKSEKTAKALLSFYKKTGIPKDAILAVPSGGEHFLQDGIDLKQDVVVESPYTGSKMKFNLLVFSSGDLYRIGSTTRQKLSGLLTESGLDETQSQAKSLFEKAGVKFEL